VQNASNVPVGTLSRFAAGIFLAKWGSVPAGTFVLIGVILEKCSCRNTVENSMLSRFFLERTVTRLVQVSHLRQPINGCDTPVEVFSRQSVVFVPLVKLLVPLHASQSLLRPLDTVSFVCVECSGGVGYG
jgi:hypothetical protein